MPRLPMLLTVFVLLALWVASGATYADLPDSIPMHFDAAGRANRWAAKSLMSWFLMPIVALAIGGLLLGLAQFIHRIPVNLLNMPNKDGFLKLSPDRQRDVLHIVQRMMEWIALAPVVLLAAIQYGMYETARGNNIMPNLLIGALAFHVVIIGLVVWMYVAVNREIDRDV